MSGPKKRSVPDGVPAGIAHILFSAMDSQHLQGHYGVTSAALAIRECTEHLAVHLSKAQQSFGFRGTSNANLSYTGNVFSSSAGVGRIGVRERAWFDG